MRVSGLEGQSVTGPLVGRIEASMKRSMAIIVFVVLAGLTTAAAKPKFTSTWKTPNAPNVSYAGKKVVGVVVTNDLSLQMSAEEALVRALNERGVQGVAAYRLIPREELKDPARAKDWVDRSGAAGVVILRLIDLTREKIPTSVVWSGASYYGSLWTYYPYAWGSTFEIVPSRTDVRVVVESLVFDVVSNKLLWAGTSEASNPKGAQELVQAIVEEAAAQMKKDGLIKK